MSGVIMTRATLGDDFIKGLTADLFDIKDQVDQELALMANTSQAIENLKSSSIFRSETTVQAEETINGISQLGDLELTQEGEDYNSDSYISTFKTVFRPIKKTQSVTLTEEDIDDQITTPKLDRTRKLLVSAKRTINKDSFDVFNKAFTAQASLPKHLTFYGDSVPVCSVIHPIKGIPGTTQSNASATGIPLTETNLEIARIALQAQVGDKAGEQLNIGDGQLVLVVPNTLEKQAVIITDSKLRSNTTNNDMNIYDGNITVMSSKRLNTSGGGLDTQWFLMDSSMTPLIFMSRRPITLSAPYQTKSNKNITWDVSTRYQVGNDDFRGVWGSKGDLQAYSL
jgi:hypothetical protein